MAEDTTKIVISLEAVLRNLERTLRGLDQVKKRLDSIAAVKVTQQSATSTDKAALASQKLALQQQRLIVQAQELANRQERARQATERLAQAQERLNRVQERAAKIAARPQLGAQQDAQVRAFRAIEADRKRVQSAQQRFDRQFAAESKRQQAAADSLQRQRSAALIKQFREQERAAERTANAFRDRFLTLGSVFSQVGQAVTSFGTTLSVALTAPLTAIGILATRNAVTLDSLTRGLTAIVGSASEAGIQLARLTEIAKLPGIGFQEAIQGSIRLQAVGFSAEVAERSLRQFANAVALTGGGRDELNRITVQLGQLSAKGKVLAQDLKPIIEAGPAVGKALLQAFGTVNSEDIQKLGLTSKEFIDQLLTALENLPRAAAGARNTFENFTDAVFRASSAIGTAILPVLTKLIETIEPLVTRLAQGFANLPPVVQTTTVVFAGLVAAVGPFAFIAGQIISSVGGMITAFARLAALGLTPTIQGFQLLTQVMRGNASLLAGQAATTAAAAGGWIALAGAIGAAVAVIAVVGIAIAAYSKSQKDAIKISNEQIAATKDQIDSLKGQIKFLDGLKTGVEKTADEQERLADIYATLNTQAKIRVTAITDEEKRLAGLREELNRILQLRNAERVQQAANLAASLANTNAQLVAAKRSREQIADLVRANTELAAVIEATGKVTAEQAKELERLGLGPGATAKQAIFALTEQNNRLIDSQTELIKKTEELNGTAEEQGAALKVLAQQTGLSARELLSAAKAMGLFKGNVEDALPAIERFIVSQEKAAKNTDIFTEALRKQNEELQRAGKSADDASKQRNDIIRAAASLAREASDSFEGALKFLNAFIAANPDLRAAIEKERQLAGKSFQEFIEDALGGRPEVKGQSALRNAQQQLADSIAEVATATSEQRATNERLTNERLLQINETFHRLQLISYREYLEQRAALTTENLDLEINAAGEAVRVAREAQNRLLGESLKKGLPEAERVKRQAQANQALETAIRHETRLAELEAERVRLAEELKTAFQEAAIQQLKDVRQLEIQYGELTGRIEDALNTATDERFRESLKALGDEQVFLSRKIRAATKAHNADLVEELTARSALNQRHIEAINNIIIQERATNRLAAVQDVIEKAKQRQSDLEEQIANDVELRGLSEEEAIRRRLAGERELREELIRQRDRVEAVALALFDAGRTVPKALTEFISQTDIVIDRLGKLTFSEQFRLAEKEFNRINDERIKAIQNVERAVRNRTIAEVEGQIIIRQINKEYTGDLEAQLALLKQIADASGQEALKRQADEAGEVVKDTKDEIGSLSQQIEAAGKDALRSGFADFFNDLLNRTATAKDALLNLLNSVVTRINDVIAENLSKKLFESIFGGADKAGGGIIAKIRGLFGGGNGAEGGIGSAVTGATQTADATTAATALTTGATAAATALTTGGVTASTALVTSLTAAAASFSAAIIAAGAAFAATVAASGASQAIGGLGGALGNAATGLFPAVPGGMYRVVEGGYPEAVITTDPKHAARQVSILRELIQRTKGFYGRIQVPDLAVGGIVSRETAEANLLDSINRAPSFSPRLSDAALETASNQGLMNLRIVNQVQSAALVRPYLSSEEGTRDVLNIISQNSNTVLRRIRG